MKHGEPAPIDKEDENEEKGEDNPNEPQGNQGEQDKEADQGEEHYQGEEDYQYDKQDDTETEGSRENEIVEFMDVKIEVCSPDENVPTNGKIWKTNEFELILY